ncbi:MAG: phenylalanine--tRNA ligase subunit beta [Anaerolineae bacterium]|nr:phenylalanine--tRNA ligase subunit beta [Anaerolineae bacterium]
MQIKPSPYWLQRRLLMCGMRPINNIVDVTNYVMLETGQPIHAFDYDILVARAGGTAPTIITRTARPGETITTLDEVHRDLDDFTEMVCDTAGVLSIAGIIGGAESEIRPDTTNILLEVASWNFINLRRTLAAQRERGKEINSEAGARFSRGVHPDLALPTNMRAIEMMRQLGGGQIAQGVIDDYPMPPPVAEVDLPLAMVQRISGLPLTMGEVVDILTRLEFACTVTDDGAAVHVVTPPHRLDISPDDPLTARADLVEEITRIYGYDRIPNTLIVDELPPQRANASLEREERVRDVLVEAGLYEVITYRLTTVEREALLTPPGARSDWPDAPYVRLANPTSQDKVAMRHTLLAGLLDVTAANLRFRDRVAIFEAGAVFLPVAGEALPDEPARLSIVMTGPRRPPTWADRADPGPMDFFDLKGVVETLAGALHLPDVTYTPAEHSTFHPGRVASLNVAGASVGVFGELHPLVRDAFELPDGAAVLAAEFDLEAIKAQMSTTFRVQPLSRYQAVYQDIAVVVDADLPAGALQAAIMRAGAPLLIEARLFDVYTGAQVPAGKKSLAYALTYQSDAETLTDRAVAKVQERVVKALSRQFGAELRA